MEERLDEIDFRPYVMRVTAAGAIAGVMLALLQMIFEGAAGAGFWSFPVFIAATILRELQQVPIPVPFLAGAVVLGLAWPIFNSVVFATVFAVLVLGLRNLGLRILLGIVYSLVIFVILWFGILPMVDPAMLQLNGFVFGCAHVLFGWVLALVLGRQSLTASLAPQPTLQH
jgi:hypothetical protein